MRAADAALLERRLAEAGVPPVRRILVHENRAVVLTLARGVLRIHRGFAYAPDRVLRAIVTFLGARRRVVRRAAERELLAFQVHEYVPAPPPRRRPDCARVGDRRLLQALRNQHAALNARHFGGSLSQPGFRLSDRMRTRLAEVRVEGLGAGPIEIGVSRRHLERDGWDEVERTLLHEMVHQWQVESGLPLDHGPAFRRKAREVGAEAAARRRVRSAAARRRPERERED